MAAAKKKKRYRLQFALRYVAEIEVSAETPEEAITLGREKDFVKDHTLLGPDWDEVDGNAELMGVSEDTPGWKFMETDR